MMLPPALHSRPPNTQPAEVVLCAGRMAACVASAAVDAVAPSEAEGQVLATVAGPPMGPELPGDLDGLVEDMYGFGIF